MDDEVEVPIQYDGPEVEEEALTPPLPDDLANYFIAIYNDPEVSSFERTQSALGLQMFWVGAELNRFNEQLEEAAGNV